MTNRFQALDHLPLGRIAGMDDGPDPLGVAVLKRGRQGSQHGAERDLVATSGKDGVLRVVDRQTRERLFETPVTTIENAKAPVTRDLEAIVAALGPGAEREVPSAKKSILKRFFAN